MAESKLIDAIMKDGRVNISVACAAKIGSIIVHADEATSAGGHTFDIEALKPLLNDDDVRAFCKLLGPLVPRKRSKKDMPKMPKQPRDWKKI